MIVQATATVEETAVMVRRALHILSISHQSGVPREWMADEYANLCWDIKQAFDTSTDPRMAGILAVWEAA